MLVVKRFYLLTRYKNEFIEIQVTAEGKTFNKGQMDELLERAKKGITKLIDIQRNLLKDIIWNSV